MSELKERLDIVLVSKGFLPSREQARAAIMAGKVYVDGKKTDKAGEKIKVTASIEYKGDLMPYVSRGGLKLEKAIKKFNIDLNNKVCLDIGASTGGFTDCMLQNGAKKVFSVDVGYGQFAWKLRVDPRVVCMERTNVRYVTKEHIADTADFASIDVSFISLTKVILPVVNLLSDQGNVVALIKPQFEAGKDKVGKKGVVREASTHMEVINKIIDFLKTNSLKVIGVDFSPITGPEGNIEYLVYFTKDPNYVEDFDLNEVKLLVEAAHSQLNI